MKTVSSTHRARLRERLVRDGLLYASPAQKIVRPDGSEAPWMFDSLGFTLSADGARLAARALLEVLQNFEGRQLATYGLTAVPLLQAVVMESGGKYRGLLVRKEVKPRGSLKRIEGRLDFSQPVIVLDDSVASGSSVLSGVQHLREAGLEVEGAVCLLRFGFEGTATLRAHGVKLVSLFDLDDDVSPRLREPVPVVSNPSWREVAGAAGPVAKSRTLPELAREVMAAWLDGRRILKAPKLPGAPVGGVFVSLRQRGELDVRPARGGVICFPEERRVAVGEALVQAALQTAQELEEKGGRLDGCAIAVTVFSPLERCELADVDPDRFGILVRSVDRKGRIGGALPRMPGIRDAWGQFNHAAYKNAQLLEGERFELYRHTLEKHVEAGEAWQPTGVPRAQTRWAETRAAAQWTRWARERVLGSEGEPPKEAWPDNVTVVILTVFRGGELCGCVGDRTGEDPAALIRKIAGYALEDTRFARRDGEVTVTLSFLEHELEVGDYGPDEVMGPTRLGQQAMEVWKNGDGGLLLPQVMVMQNLEPADFAQLCLDKAGLKTRPFTWHRYDATSWLSREGSVRPFIDGAELSPPSQPKVLARHWRSFLAAHHQAKGEPVVRYEPFSDHQHTGTTPHWLLHSAWVKARAGLTAQAKQDFARVDFAQATLTELSFGVLSAVALGRDDGPLAHRLLEGVGPTGMPRLDDAAWLDFTPGQLWLALAHSTVKLEGAQVDRGLAFLRRRWRAVPSWGAVSWVSQAFAAWALKRRDPSLLSMCREVFDWALPQQSKCDGAFLDGQVPWTGAGATTAVYLEGLAASVAAARRLKVKHRWDQALERGFGYLDRLTWQPRDAGILPNPAYAVGGLRTGLLRSDVRLDFVQHALSAALYLT